MQIYSEMIGNVMIDARSTGKYYHCKCKGGVQVAESFFSPLVEIEAQLMLGLVTR